MINFTAGAPSSGGGKGGSGPSGGKNRDQGTGTARVKLYSSRRIAARMMGRFGPSIYAVHI